MWTRGQWTDGTRTLTGWWRWAWSAQRFYIQLDHRDEITGRLRYIETTNDTPEWGKWKLVEDNKD